MAAQPGTAAPVLDAGGDVLPDVLASTLADVAVDPLTVLGALDDAPVAAVVVEEVVGAAVLLDLLPPHATRLTSRNAAAAIDVARQAGVLWWLLPPCITVVPS